MSFTITDLRCNHMAEPIGIDDMPHFSFKLVSKEPEECLAAYSILVSDKTDVVWDSGRIGKDEQVMICYGGAPLLPETVYTWKVRVWNQKGEVSESEPSLFMTGRMQPYNWEAKWITPVFQGDVLVGNRLWGNYSLNPYLRKEFVLRKPVQEAVLFISGVGYYECWINGKSVKDTVLDPAFTAYDRTTMYQTHRIENLTEGNNAIAISLGDGMYNCSTHDVWNYANASWRDVPKCICILKITYTDGTQERICSGPDFKAVMGNYTANDLRTLDEYDAGRDFEGWTQAGYDDSGWPFAVIARPVGGELKGQYTTPIRVVDEYDPVLIEKISDTMWIADAGVNTVGWAEISMTAPKGTVIELVYAERFEEDFSVVKNHLGEYEPSNKPLFQKTRYIASGKGKEIWHSCFKYNGFRYIKISCETKIPADFALKIQEVRTDFEQTGAFSCSDPMLNQIQEITCRATRTNFHNMPTDCPTREKNGWTGDAQLSCEQLLYNYDGFAAYSRWMDDVLRAQRPSGQLPGVIPSADWGYNWGNGPAWDCVCAEIPYNMYLYGGDKQVLAKMYPAVKKYLDYYDNMAVDGIAAFGLSDWCRPEKEPWHEACELNVTTVAYACHMTRIASKMAAVLDDQTEAEMYAKRAAVLKEQFRRHFISSDQGQIAMIHCTPGQTALACVLYFELFEGEAEKKWFYEELVRKIHEVGDHMDVGILGAKFVANVLINAGDAELYFKTVTNPECPSYAYMVNSGATTLWEDWYGGASRNHHMYGDVSACMYKALAGICVDEKHPAFKNTVFKPQFIAGLDDVDAWHISPYGNVAGSWKKENDRVKMTVTVPANCTGELKLPQNAVFAENGETYAAFGAGTHTFEILLRG